MRFVDEFRDPALAEKLLAQIREEMVSWPHPLKQPLQIMEVCGGHTHAIFKFGLDKLLPDSVEFVHGPGCRSVCCRWGVLMPVWKSRPVRA